MNINGIKSYYIRCYKVHFFRRIVHLLCNVIIFLFFILYIKQMTNGWFNCYRPHGNGGVDRGMAAVLSGD